MDGVLGTTHGRSYGKYLKYPDTESTAGVCWLAYGTGSLTHLSPPFPHVVLAAAEMKEADGMISYRSPSIGVLRVG